MTDSKARGSGRGILTTILAIIIALMGLWLLGLGAYLATLRGSLRSGPGLAMGVALIFSVLVAAMALTRNPNDRAGGLPNRASAPVYYAAANGDWPAYAGTWAGLKYSPLAQITPANAGKL